MPCESDAMSDNDEFGIVFAEGTKLGANDDRTAPSGEMATHPEIL